MVGSTPSVSRQIGAILMIVGTEIGAGILALPILVAHFGLIFGSVLLFIAWLIMTYATFLLAEIDLSMAPGASFIAMGKLFFGRPTLVLIWLSSIMILYPLLVAFISAAGSNFSTIFHVTESTAVILFVVILGIFVLLGTSEVDWVNRIFIITKMLLLLLTGVFLLAKSSSDNLLYTSFPSIDAYLIAMPIFINTCVGQLIVPILRVYLDSNVKVLKRVMLIGCGIPLILYLLWVAAITGVIPPTGNNSLTTLINMGATANIGNVLLLLKLNIPGHLYLIPIYIFTSISVATSFLNVALCLKHFIIDAFSLPKKICFKQEFMLAVFVFVIPVLIVLTYKKVFLKSMGIVGGFYAILLIILPVLVIFKMQKKGYQFAYPLLKNNFINYVVLICGFLILIAEIVGLFFT